MLFVRMSVESVTILFAIRKNGWSNQVTIQIFTIEIYGPKFIQLNSARSKWPQKQKNAQVKIINVLCVVMRHTYFAKKVHIPDISIQFFFFFHFLTKAIISVGRFAWFLKSHSRPKQLNYKAITNIGIAVITTIIISRYCLMIAIRFTVETLFSFRFSLHFFFFLLLRF